MEAGLPNQDMSANQTKEQAAGVNPGRETGAEIIKHPSGKPTKPTKPTKPIVNDAVDSDEDLTVDLYTKEGGGVMRVHHIEVFPNEAGDITIQQQYAPFAEPDQVRVSFRQIPILISMLDSAAKDFLDRGDGE